jgi:hypothetical protein
MCLNLFRKNQISRVSCYSTKGPNNGIRNDIKGNNIRYNLIEVIPMILVSSCLAGLEVRYNGTHSLDNKIRKLIEENKAITV